MTHDLSPSDPQPGSAVLGAQNESCGHKRRLWAPDPARAVRLETCQDCGGVLAETTDLERMVWFLAPNHAAVVDKG